MHTASLHRRNLVLVVVILTVFFSLTYYRHAAYHPSLSSPEIQTPPSEFVKPAVVNDDKKSVEIKEPEIPKEPTACDAVDAHWLASDRTYWDGWESKAMFMKPDGAFTTENVYITAGDSVCIVVLLGPIPAVSAIRPEKHHAPADSITIYAQGERTRVPILMEQHPKHGNVYLSSVKFTQPDTYHLESTTEYRSYFWETPIYHPYRPFHYVSYHNLTVAAASATTSNVADEKPICSPEHLKGGGSWVNRTDFEQLFPTDFYTMFGEKAGSHAQDDFVFIPNDCRIDYMNDAHVKQCLAGKTVHVWGDRHVQRNLEAFRSGDRWCREEQEEQEQEINGNLCGCQVPDAPWWSDPSVPIPILEDNVSTNISIHFKHFGTITLQDHRENVKEQAMKLPRADIVILSFGNDDIALNRLTPQQFEQSFSDIVGYFAQHVYPDQTIIVRTPQYFCCGLVHSTSWNSGRSLAFTNVVRQITRQLSGGGGRILLWDIHRLGLPGNTCPGSPDTKRDVIDTENVLLWDLICR